jgi:oxalate decarboxylase/phosphoglucose isomerase-like protein (cupin superfamily)
MHERNRLIERGDQHEIRNTGKEPLRTVNVYVPAAEMGEALANLSQEQGQALTLPDLSIT